jgi:hypothetical protein
MAIGDDFTITGLDIRYSGTIANYTGIEFHRWLQDLADDAVASGDDFMDITNETPTERSTDNIFTLINGYNIDDTAAQHLYDCSIIQTGGDEIWDGIVVLTNAGAYVNVVQDGALITPNFWTTGLNADASNGISHRFMIKVRTAGADIDGRRLLGQTREFGFSYSEFPINGTARGNNVMALTYVGDLNNETVAGTVATWTTITNTEGYNLIDVDNDSVDEFYYSQWNRDTYSINQFFERMKWLSRRGSVSTIYGLNGELFRGITHELNIDTPTGTFSSVEEVTWSGGSGQMLAINSPTAGTKMWIQLLTGIAPTDNQLITGTTSSATVLVNVTIIDRPKSQPFIGASTGSSLIGAYGVGVEALDLSATDKLFSLANVQKSPPNYVTFTVLGLVSGDRVLVGPETGASFNLAQFTLNTSLTTATETAVVINVAIPLDTPASGTIRIQTDSGLYVRVPYTSFTGSTFTITSTSFLADEATAANEIMISYLDGVAAGATMSFTSVYVSDRSLFIRVRDGGGTPIKTFQTTGTLSSGGGSTNVIRQSDE